MCRRWSGVLGRADHAIAEWTIEQGDVRDSRELMGGETHHELLTDFLKVPLG